MKYIIKITIITSVFVLSSFIMHSVYAQDFSPLGKLAQDYILRLNSDSNTVPVEDSVIVNPEAITQDAITESIDTISKAVEDLTKVQDQVILDIKADVKENIDTSIVDIRKKQVEKPAYELQRSIDGERTQLFENVVQTIKSINPTKVSQDSEKIQELEKQVGTSLDKIEQSLKTESGFPVNFEKSRRDIRDTLIRFQEILVEKQKIIESRQGEFVFKDSDTDGVSDYDEMYIYKTDPIQAQTKGGDKTDGQKISEGINPLSDIGEKINYQDPRTDKESFVSNSYRVNKVQLLNEEGKKLVFEGTALPNTYITLYIYSTPIIVTVKTDENGVWNYKLDKELENGEHQIYVATVDASGRIVTRSNPILFTKTAEAATIGISGTFDGSASAQNFLKDNFILIILATFIAIVIIGMMFAGDHKNIGSAISELKNEVNNKK